MGRLPDAVDRMLYYCEVADARPNIELALSLSALASRALVTHRAWSSLLDEELNEKLFEN